jgi:hypothetical protein
MRFIVVFFLTISSVFAQFSQGHFGHAIRTGTSEAYSPSDDPTLELWFRADDFGGLDSTVITTAWLDTSGNNNDAAVTGSPVLIENKLNGHKVVRFTNNSFSGTCTKSTLVSIYLVYNSQVSTLNGIFSLMRNSPYEGISFYTNNTTGFIVYGAGSSNSLNTSFIGDKSFKLRTVIVDTDSIRAFINSDRETAGITEISYADNGFGIGRFYSNSTAYGYTGDIAEIIVYNKAHSDAEREQVENYLTTKYFPSQDIDMDDLQLWLVADDISGADASTITSDWPDQSYYFGRDATPAGDPTIEVAEINNHRATNYDGVGDYFLGSKDTTDVFSAYMVYKVTNTTLGAVFSQMDQGSPNLGWLYADNTTANQMIYYFNNGASQDYSTVTNTTNWEIASIIATGSADTLYIDGSQADVNTKAPDYASLLYGIGTYYTDNKTFNLTGYIAEIIIYSVEHTTSQRQTIETYLNNKYSIY